MIKTTNIDGFNFVEDNMSSFLAKILKLSKNKTIKVVTPNPEIYIKYTRNRNYRNLLQSFDYALCDGAGLQIAYRLSGVALPRLTGTDMVSEILKDQSLKVYVIGSSCVACKKLNLVGSNTSKITKSSYGSIVKDLKELQPDVVMVALGAPLQEELIAFLADQLQLGLLIGVGGAIDYVSNTVSRAPKFLRSLGLEWLYRLIRQPKRIWRICNALFVFPIVFLRNKF